MSCILPQLRLISQSDWLIYRCQSPDNVARVNVSRNAFLDLYVLNVLNICSDFTVDDDITNISDDISDEEITSCVNICSNLTVEVVFS